MGSREELAMCPSVHWLRRSCIDGPTRAWRIVWEYCRALPINNFGLLLLEL